MSILQKVLLTCMVVCVGFGSLFTFAAKGCDEEKYRTAYAKLAAYNILAFIVSMIVFCISWIW